MGKPAVLLLDVFLVTDRKVRECRDEVWQCGEKPDRAYVKRKDSISRGLSSR